MRTLRNYAVTSQARKTLYLSLQLYILQSQHSAFEAQEPPQTDRYDKCVQINALSSQEHTMESTSHI